MEVVPQLGISLPLQTGEPDGGSSSGVCVVVGGCLSFLLIIIKTNQQALELLPPHLQVLSFGVFGPQEPHSHLLPLYHQFTWRKGAL